MGLFPARSALVLAGVIAITGTLAAGPAPNANATPATTGDFSGAGRHRRPIALPGVPGPGQSHGHPRSRRQRPRRRLEPRQSAARGTADHGAARCGRLQPRLHQDQPELVIDAIRQVVTAVRDPSTWN